VFCQRTDALIPRRRSEIRGLKQAIYHRICYGEWRRGPAMREKSRKWGGLGEIRKRVAASGDLDLLQEVKVQIAAELRHLKNPDKQGRPPVLLQSRVLAKEM